MSVYCECCVLSGRGLCDELIIRPRGVLPTVMRRCVWSRNLVNGEALAHWGLLRQKKKKKYIISLAIYLLTATLYTFTQVKQLRLKPQGNLIWHIFFQRSYH